MRHHRSGRRRHGNRLTVELRVSSEHIIDCRECQRTASLEISFCSIDAADGRDRCIIRRSNLAVTKIRIRSGNHRQRRRFQNLQIVSGRKINLAVRCGHRDDGACGRERCISEDSIRLRGHLKSICHSEFSIGSRHLTCSCGQADIRPLDLSRIQGNILAGIHSSSRSARQGCTLSRHRPGRRRHGNRLTVELRVGREHIIDRRKRQCSASLEISFCSIDAAAGFDRCIIRCNNLAIAKIRIRSGNHRHGRCI